MISVYRHETYRQAFKALFSEKRKSPFRLSTAKLASHIQVQPSHLTNVIKERNHFSSDQIAALGSVLGLEEDEIEYLDLLKEWERAEFKPRKNKLHKKVKEIRDQKLRTSKELKVAPLILSNNDLEKYYLDPNYELIHLYCGTTSASTNPETIGRLWSLPAEYIAQILNFLQTRGFIELRKNRWQVKPIHQLLPTSSPLCQPQQLLKRIRVIEAIQKLPPKEIYAFSGAFTMTEDTKLYIQGLFVDFLKEVEVAVLKSEPEHIYHLQFDLIPWISKSK